MQLPAPVRVPDAIETAPVRRPRPAKDTYAAVELKSLVKVYPPNKGPLREDHFVLEGTGETSGWEITLDGPWVKITHPANRSRCTLVPMSNVACLSPHPTD
jgi:hypothetical protein